MHPKMSIIWGWAIPLYLPQNNQLKDKWTYMFTHNIINTLEHTDWIRNLNGINSCSCIHYSWLLLLLSCFSHVWLCATPEMAAHQAPSSLGFSRQEHWSGLPFPSPMHETEKWKWSRSVMSDSSRPHGQQPIRLLCPWDFQGKSTGVGCHRLLCHYSQT